MKSRQNTRAFLNTYNKLIRKRQKSEQDLFTQKHVEKSNNFFRELEKNFRLILNPTIKQITSKISNGFIFSKITKNEVEDVMHKNQPKNCVDCSGLNYTFLKKMSDPLATCWQQLFHRCISEIFLGALNMAKFVTLHREGDKHEPPNYMSMFLLPTIWKFFEKLIYNCLVQFLDGYPILSEKRFGFRNKRSTVDAIAKLLETICQLWTKRTYMSCCTFLYLKKAFDTVDHKFLFLKCYCYGFGKERYKFIESLLMNRKQYIQIGTRKSS